MNKKRWEKIEHLFEESLKIDAELRSDFLKLECGDDTDLFEEVLSLLKEDSEVHSIFTENAAQSFFPQHEMRKEGSLIGSYRIIKKIASGGMGDVYLAERADGEFEQKVALKLIRPGSSSLDVIARFKSERQILAKLQHPNIARLLDGGLTDDGLPFFTMEFVDGIPIDEYCDKKKLTINQRLSLFSNVCSAVQYAHQNLIIHRDLKPSNILITVNGQVKLLDFGISKVFTEEPNDAGLTSTGVFVMTPEYASPEQIRSEMITTASDIYSLGLILYKLLTGDFPYRIKNFTPLELERSICLTEPEKPSTLILKTIRSKKHNSNGSSERFSNRKIEAESLRKNLSGELDNICLLALRKEPALRYVSAEQFKSDIDKYLKGLPVSAHPPTIKYRTQKFVRRHKAAVTAAIFIFAAVTILTTFYFIQLKEERDKARLEAEKSAKVSEFLVDIFKVANPSESRGEMITARELLDKGAEKIENELTNQPDIKATLLEVIGNVYSTLGMYDEAKNLVENSLKIRTELNPRSIETAKSFNSLGNIHILKGEYDLAMKMLQNAKNVISNSENDQSLLEANILQNFGTLSNLLGNYQKADSFYVEALNIFKNIPSSKELMLTAMNNLALLKHEDGKYEESEQLYKEAYTLQKELYNDKPHPELATTTYNYAQLLRDMGKYNEAELMFKNSLRMDKALHNNEHPDVAYSLQGLATIYSQKGNYTEALKLHTQSLEMRKKFFGDEHPDVAHSTFNLARIKYESGKLIEAEKDFTETMRIRKKLYGEEHPAVAKTLEKLSEISFDLGNYEKSKKLLDAAENIILKTIGEENLSYALILLNKAQLLNENQKYDDAIETSVKALLISERVGGSKEIPFYAGALYFTARHYDDKKDFSTADSLLQESVRIHLGLYGENHIRTSTALMEYGRHKLLADSLADAENLLKKSINIFNNNLSEKSTKLALAESILGEIYLRMGKYDEAEKYLKNSYDFIRTSYGPKSKTIKKILHSLVLIYERSGKNNIAQKYRNDL
jgi:eukaryotic-like serine/threonine-protein kinase